MKNLGFLSICALLALTACGGKSSVLKAREAAKGAPTTSAKSGKVDGALYSPSAGVSEIKKLNAEGTGKRNLMLQKVSIMTTFLCTQDLANLKTLALDSTLKMQTGSQIIVGQDVTTARPENEGFSPKEQTPKAVLNIACQPASGAAPAKPASVLDDEAAAVVAAPTHFDQLPSLITLQTSEDLTEFSAKLGVTVATATLRKIHIACVIPQKMATADLLLAQKVADGADLVLAAGSKIYFETEITGDDKQVIKHLIVSCELDPNAKTPLDPVK
jgi:hypothetical protein